MTKHRKQAGAVVAIALFLLALPPLSRSQASDWKQIQAPQLRRFEPPMPKRVQLPNGMVLFFLEDHELPLIRVGIAGFLGKSGAREAQRAKRATSSTIIWKPGQPPWRPRVGVTQSR